MLNLKQDNERLQKIVTNQSLQSSCSSLQSPPMSNHTPQSMQYFLVKSKFILLLGKFYIFYYYFFSGDDAIETSLLPSLDSDTTLVQVNVFLGSHGNYSLYKGNITKTCVISSLPVSPKSKWDMIDHLVIKGFKVGYTFFFMVSF